MKLKYIRLSFIAASFTLCSCSDFLDRQPLTDNTDEGFFTDPIQLQAYCNKKYELLPDFKDVNLFTDDQKSDNQAPSASARVTAWLALFICSDRSV